MLDAIVKEIETSTKFMKFFAFLFDKHRRLSSLGSATLSMQIEQIKGPPPLSSSLSSWVSWEHPAAGAV